MKKGRIHQTPGNFKKELEKAEKVFKKGTNLY